MQGATSLSLTPELYRARRAGYELELAATGKARSTELPMATVSQQLNGDRSWTP